MSEGRQQTLIYKIFKRYFIDAMGAMALGLFSSLIIGLILTQLARLPGLSFIAPLTEVLDASSPVVGAAIGVAIAWGLKCDGMVVFSCAGAGAIGYAFGGPVGAFIAAVIGAECGQLVSKRTPVDIVVTPIVTIVTGGFFGHLVGPSISSAMDWLGQLVNAATVLSPLPMGIAVGVIVGMVLTLPISSAALCIMLGLSGLAGGAATAGCAAQMVGFAVASYRENKIGGLVAQGIGTSMLQFGNICRRPQILIAPTLASAILGPISTAVFGMVNNAMGAGMGTSGLVGQFGAYSAMTAAGFSPAYTLFLILLMHVLLPAALSLGISELLRKIGWVRFGDQKLEL